MASGSGQDTAAAHGVPAWRRRRRATLRAVRFGPHYGRRGPRVRLSGGAGHSPSGPRRPGSRPSHGRFAVSASRNPSTPDFSDVLHQHPYLHLLDYALCSPARSLPAKPTQRPCADPARFVTADSPGNPPICRVDLSATRHPRLPARSGRHGPGRRRAGPGGPFRSTPERTQQIQDFWILISS